MNETVRLRLADGVIITTTYLTWRRFLFTLAMRLHDTRPLKSSKKQIFRREYLAFCNARLRCEDVRNPHYGGRGIEFHFATFQEFIDEIGPRPKGYVLDRIDNDGNYERGNVRWVTPKESRENSRNEGRPKGSKNKTKDLTDGVERDVTSSPGSTNTNEHLEPQRREEGRQSRQESAR